MKYLWVVLLTLLTTVGCDDTKTYTVAGFHWRSEVYGNRVVTVTENSPRNVTSTVECGFIPLQFGSVTMYNPIYCPSTTEYCDHAHEETQSVLLSATEGMNRQVVPPAVDGRRSDHCFVRFDSPRIFSPVDCSRWAEFTVGTQVVAHGIPRFM